MKLDQPIITDLKDKVEQSQIQKSEPRPHLGVSELGRECPRQIWYKFRFFRVEQFEPRMLRLFKRGQEEEDKICDDLRRAGHPVRDRQRRVRVASHVHGSIDGIIEWEGKSHLIEMKTHNKKSFDDLEKNGVEKSKPEHFAQMQVYMLGCDLERAWYYAVCKDDDRIHTERVKLKKSYAIEMVKRADDISLSMVPPEKISNNASWYQCKFCSFHDICHYDSKDYLKNCRTCRHGEPQEDGSFRCGMYDKIIPFGEQVKEFICWEALI
jgi:CRISPR/Cas system-associated exonuclease Cas4 (RecB family)